MNKAEIFPLSPPRLPPGLEKPYRLPYFLNGGKRGRSRRRSHGGKMERALHGIKFYLCSPTLPLFFLVAVADVSPSLSCLFPGPPLSHFLSSPLLASISPSSLSPPVVRRVRRRRTLVLRRRKERNKGRREGGTDRQNQTTAATSTSIAATAPPHLNVSLLPLYLRGYLFPCVSVSLAPSIPSSLLRSTKYR